MQKMKCPKCNLKAQTLETRTRRDQVVRRRYSCDNNHLFTTLEVIIDVPKAQLHKKPEVVKGRGKFELHEMWLGANGTGRPH